MCGIAAIFAYSQDAPGVDQGELVAIRDSMAARGPDGSGLWFDSGHRVGFGHRRLSILDVSAAGAQPMLWPERQLSITFNGEIYNYRELRDSLEKSGHQFASDCDTEVLLHLYAEEGEAMLEKLRGMFAFALWDGATRTLFLARDPFGVKPLYWADDGKTFRAASQVKALLAGGRMDTSPEPAGHVGYFLWGHIPAPYTLYRGIRSLPAGHSLTLKAGGRKRLHSFCDISSMLAEAESQTADLRLPISDLLASSLRDSVRHHLVSDVPVGVFLSSGLDSTTIAGLAAESGTQLRTVTLGFAEFKGTSNDETSLAEEVARRCGASHQTVWVTRKDFENDLDRVFHAMDQPSCDGVNSYFISKAAAQSGLKVALSGLGGDELFGGYPSFLEIPRAVSGFKRFNRFPMLGRTFRVVTAPLLKRMTSPKYAGLLEYGGSYGGAYLLRRGMFMPWELPQVLDGEIAREGWNELQTLARLDETARGIHSPHLKLCALEMSWYMRHQLLRDADWAGMVHSLEVRVPLVDVELLRNVAGLFLRSSPPTKRDMARTPRLPLPASVLNRPKTGFQVPVREWMLEGRQNAESRTGKSEERGLRGWAKLVYSRFASGSLPPTLKESVFGWRPAVRRRVLVFRIGQLGDTIIAMPAMSAVRKHFAGAHIGLLCDRHPAKSYILASDLLRGTGLFDEYLSYLVYENPERLRGLGMAPLIFAIRKMRFDTLVYLAPTDRSKAQVDRDYNFFRLAGIKDFLGMSNFPSLPAKIPGQSLPRSTSEAEKLLARLAADGVPVPERGQARAELRVGLAEETEVALWLDSLRFDGGRVWVGVGPGSKMPAKRWPEIKFQAVIGELIKRLDVWPVVFGGAEDADLGRRLTLAWGRGYNAAGALSLRASASAMKHCAILLTNDTGTMHLAAAAGVRCVALFSSRAAPGQWNPLGHGHMVFRSNIECEGCGLTVCAERNNECLNRIRAEEVLEACETMLRAQTELVNITG